MPGFSKPDACGGYTKVYEANRKPGPLVEAACWVHDLESVFMLSGRSASERSPVMAASGTRHNSRRREPIRRRVGERHADATANIVER